MRVCKIDYIDSLSNLKSICEEELPHCDALATLISSWHFNNLLALINLKKVQNVFCIITPQMTSLNCYEFRLTPEMISPNIDNRFLHICFFTGCFDFSIINQINLVFKKRMSITYICPGLRPDLRLLFAFSVRPSNFWGIDEGLGTYVSVAEFRKSLPNSNKNYFLLTLLKDSMISLLNRILFSHVDSYYLFKKTSDKTLELNTLILPFLRSQFLRCIGNQVKQSPPSVVILVDNFSVARFADIRQFIYKIVSLLSPKYVVYIKNHPNDSVDEFSNFQAEYPNVRILDSSRGAEACIAECNPSLLIGGYSTSLFVGSAIFEIKAISYMNLYLNEIPASAIYDNQIKYFINAFRDNQLIKFPLTITEFLNEIKLLSDEK